MLCHPGQHLLPCLRFITSLWREGVTACLPLQGDPGGMKEWLDRAVLDGARTHTGPCIQVFQEWWPDARGGPAPAGTEVWH